jgi:glucose-1-phosphatase
MIKAITFDLDGVYFVNGKSNFIKTLAGLGVGEEEAVRVFLKSGEMNKFYKEGRWTDKQYWEWAIKEWGLSMAVEEIVKLLIDGYETNKRVAETVKKVRKAGYKTLICSNNFPARINGLQKRFGFLDNFDAWALSYEVEVTKPSPTIFKELVSKAGVKASEIVFADDNEDNLSGARRVGIQTFFYEDFDKYLEDLRSVGVKT